MSCVEYLSKNTGCSRSNSVNLNLQDISKSSQKGDQASPSASAVKRTRDTRANSPKNSGIQVSVLLQYENSLISFENICQSVRLIRNVRGRSIDKKPCQNKIELRLIGANRGVDRVLGGLFTRGHIPSSCIYICNCRNAKYQKSVLPVSVVRIDRREIPILKFHLSFYSTLPKVAFTIY